MAEFLQKIADKVLGISDNAEETPDEYIKRNANSISGYDVDSALKAREEDKAGVARTTPVVTSTETTEQKASRLLSERKANVAKVEEGMRSGEITRNNYLTVDTNLKKDTTYETPVVSSAQLASQLKQDTAPVVYTSTDDIDAAAKEAKEKEKNKPSALKTVLQNFNVGVDAGVDAVLNTGKAIKVYYDNLQLTDAERLAADKSPEFQEAVQYMVDNHTNTYKGISLDSWKKSLTSKMEKGEQNEAYWYQEGANDSDKLANSTVWSEKKQARNAEIAENTAELGGVGQFFASMANSAGFMMPSIAVGTLAGGIASAGLGVAGMTEAAAATAGLTKAYNTAQAIGSAAGLATMFENVYANDVKQLTQEGYEWDKVADKAFLDATVEVATEMLVGGTPVANVGLFDNFVNGAVSKATAKIGSNLVAKYGEKAAGSAIATAVSALGTWLAKDATGKAIAEFLGESAEEMVSEILAPVIDRGTGINPDAKLNIGDVLTAGLSGGMLSVILSAPGNLYDSIQQGGKNEGKSLFVTKDANGRLTLNLGKAKTNNAAINNQQSMEAVVTYINDVVQNMSVGNEETLNKYLGKDVLGTLLKNGIKFEERPTLLKYHEGMKASEIKEYVEKTLKPAINIAVANRMTSDGAKEFDARISSVVPREVEITADMVSPDVTQEQLAEINQVRQTGTEADWQNAVSKYGINPIRVYEAVTANGNVDVVYGQGMADLYAYKIADNASKSTAESLRIIDNSGNVNTVSFEQFLNEYLPQMPDIDPDNLSVEQKAVIMDLFNEARNEQLAKQDAMISMFDNTLSSSVGISVSAMPDEIANGAEADTPAMISSDGKEILLNKNYIGTEEQGVWVIAHELGHNIQAMGNGQALHEGIQKIADDIKFDYNKFSEDVAKNYEGMTPEEQMYETDNMFLTLLLGDETRLQELADTDGGTLEGLRVLIDGRLAKLNDSSTYATQLNDLVERIQDKLNIAEQKQETETKIEKATKGGKKVRAKNVAQAEEQVTFIDSEGVNLDKTKAQETEAITPKKAPEMEEMVDAYVEEKGYKKTKRKNGSINIDAGKERYIEISSDGEILNENSAPNVDDDLAEEFAKFVAEEAKTPKKSSSKKSTKKLAKVDKAVVEETFAPKNETVKPVSTTTTAQPVQIDNVKKWTPLKNEYEGYSIGRANGSIYILDTTTNTITYVLPNVASNWKALIDYAKGNTTQKTDITNSEIRENENLFSALDEFGISDLADTWVGRNLALPSTQYRTLLDTLDEAIGYKNYEALPKGALRDQINLFKLFNTSDVDELSIAPETVQALKDFISNIEPTKELIKFVDKNFYKMSTSPNGIAISKKIEGGEQQQAIIKKDGSVVPFRPNNSADAAIAENIREVLNGSVDKYVFSLASEMQKNIKSVADAIKLFDSSAELLNSPKENTTAEVFVEKDAKKSDTKKLAGYDAISNQYRSINDIVNNLSGAKLLSETRQAINKSLEAKLESEMPITLEEARALWNEYDKRTVENTDVIKAQDGDEPDNITWTKPRKQSLSDYRYGIEGDFSETSTGRVWGDNSKIWIQKLEPVLNEKTGKVSNRFNTIGYMQGNETNWVRLNSTDYDVTLNDTTVSKPYNITLQGNNVAINSTKDVSTTQANFKKLEGFKVTYNYTNGYCELTKPEGVHTLKQDTRDVLKNYGFEAQFVNVPTGKVLDAKTGTEVEQFEKRPTGKWFSSKAKDSVAQFKFLTGLDPMSNEVSDTKSIRTSQTKENEMRLKEAQARADRLAKQYVANPAGIKNSGLYRVRYDNSEYLVFDFGTASLSDSVKEKLRLAGFNYGKDYGRALVGGTDSSINQNYKKTPRKWGLEINKNNSGLDIWDAFVQGEDPLNLTEMTKKKLVWYQFMDSPNAKFAFIPGSKIIDNTTGRDTSIKTTDTVIFKMGAAKAVDSSILKELGFEHDSHFRYWKLTRNFTPKELTRLLETITRGSEDINVGWSLDQYRDGAYRDMETVALMNDEALDAAGYIEDYLSAEYDGFVMPSTEAEAEAKFKKYSEMLTKKERTAFELAFEQARTFGDERETVPPMTPEIKKLFDQVQTKIEKAIKAQGRFKSMTDILAEERARYQNAYNVETSKYNSQYEQGYKSYKMSEDELEDWRNKNYNKYSVSALNNAINSRSAMFGDSFARNTDAADKVNANWERLKETNGTFESGETPLSTDDKYSTKKSYISQTIDNLLTRKNIPQQDIDIIRAGTVALGMGDVIKVTNEDLYSSAVDSLNRKYAKQTNGSGMTRQELLNATNDFISSMRVNELESARQDATMAALLNEWGSLGQSQDYSSAEAVTLAKLYSEIRLSGTELARGLQARRLLYQDLPETREYHALRVTEELVKSLKEEANTKKLNTRSFKDAANQIEGFCESEEFLYELLPELRDAQTQEEIDIAEDKIAIALAQFIPATIESRIDGIRYLAMLGNPRTHIRNMASNVIMRLAVKTKNKMKGAIEDIFIGDTGERTRSNISKVTPEIQAFAEQNAADMKKRLTQGGKIGFQTQVMQLAKKFGDTKLGNFMDALNNVNSGLLEEEDWVALRASYIDALAGYISANGWTVEDISDVYNAESQNKLDKATDYATLEALKSTFRDANAVASFLNNMKESNPVAGLIIGGLMPFLRTPMNVLKRGYEYSPFGLITGVAKAFTQVGKTIGVGANKHTVTINECIDNICAGLTGTGIAVLGYFLSSLGMLKGKGSDDDREEYYDQMIGYQPYSYTFSIGDKKYNYTVDWATPICMALFMGNSVYESIKNDEKLISVNGVLDAFSQAADPLTSLSFLSGINDALNSYQDDKIGAFIITAASNYVTQFVPTLGGQVARIIDPTRRTTYAPKDSEGLFGKLGAQTLNKIENKIPFVSSSNEAYIDQWGREQSNASDAGLIGDVFNQMLSPGYSKQIQTTAVDDSILDIFEKTGNSSVLPTTPKSTQSIGSETVYLDPEDYTELKQTAGQISYDALESVFSSQYWNTLGSDMQAKIIADIYSYALTSAKKDYAKENGIKYSTSATKEVEDVKTAKAAGISVGEYFLYKNVLNNFDAKDANGKSVNGLMVQRQKNYAKSVGLSIKQVNIILNKNWKSY